VTKLRLSILASPLLCLGLLGGIVAEDATHLQPADVEPYHARARVVIEAWPTTIPEGDWTLVEAQPLPESAEQLLHPNCVISRGYRSRTIRVNGQPAQASLLIVQCKDARDMAGHYPPICYPASGEPQLSAVAFKMLVNGIPISGMQYEFLREVLPAARQCVYDFFVVPGKGVVADMAGVRKSAGDYQRRWYGAAQFQVVMNADYPPEVRDQIFREIIGASPTALTVLNTVEIP
jgi:hypothetical protein